MVGKIIKPILFSRQFGVSPTSLDAAGFIDPILNADTRLFIDPLLLEASRNAKIKAEAFTLLKSRFEEIIRLVTVSKSDGDIAWRSAMRRLDLSEAPETCLGYGGASIGGSSRPDALKQKILETLKEIIILGENDPQIISLMGLLEDGVGADTISDMTTNFIQPTLAEITEEFCHTHNVTVCAFSKYENRKLPENPCRIGYPVLLTPKDILRNLPIANDWNEVSRVIFENEEIRSAVNAMFGDITKATTTERKNAIRQTALQSLDNFREVFESLLNSGAHYDPNEDIFGYYTFRKLAARDLNTFREPQFVPPNSKTKTELVRVVKEIISNFQKQIEKNNLWELLWYNDKPRREKAAQLLLFGIANAFCEANNIDISPEMNAGGGPVDFKFSTGYKNRVLVEVKLSTGSVVHGYKKQLEVYRSASETDAAIFLVLDVGKLKGKLRTIQGIQRARREAGEITSEIILVDVSKRQSASKH